MKKYLFAPFAAAALMLGSCSNEDFSLTSGNDGNVMFSVQLPDGINTRAFSDGTTAKNLNFAVFGKGESGKFDTYLKDLDQTDLTFNDELKANVSLRLVTGKEYTIVFWADADGSPYTFDKTTGEVTVNATTNVASQDEKRDAFFAAESFKVDGPITKDITLTRPFAQINIGTSDLETFTNAGGSISKSGMTLKGYNTLNLLTGEATGEVEYSFTPAAFASDAFPYQPVTYTTYLAMDYVLMPADKQTVDVTWTSDNSSRPSVTFNSVPVQRNYRTNIFGALLTNPAEFAVMIDKNFNDNSPLTAEYDNEGYRVAESVEKANTLLAAGEPAVSVDGELFTSTSQAAQMPARTRADEFDGIAFFLNKTVPHQRLKITGEAKKDVKVSYAALGNGQTAVANPVFTLIIGKKVKGVVFDLADATVSIDGKKDKDGNKATAESVTFENAVGASVNVSNVAIDEIVEGDNFTGEVEYVGAIAVTSADEFMEATKIANATILIEEGTNIDLKDLPEIQMLGGQTLIVNGTLNTARAQIAISGEGNVLTVEGTGKITSKGLDGATGNRPLNAYDGTTLIVRNISLETEQNNGGSVIFTENADVILENIKIDCHNFAAGISGGTLKAENCIFNSDSNRMVGAHSYTVRVSDGCQAVLNNCEVNGVQGGLSVGNEGTVATINGGKYTTTSLEGYTGQTAFYPVYIWDKGVVVVNDGEFISGCSYTIYNGNNDVPELYTWGNGACLKGGKYNQGTIDQADKLAYPAADGYEWVEIEDDIFKFQVVKKAE